MEWYNVASKLGKLKLNPILIHYKVINIPPGITQKEKINGPSVLLSLMKSMEDEISYINWL